MRFLKSDEKQREAKAALLRIRSDLDRVECLLDAGEAGVRVTCQSGTFTVSVDEPAGEGRLWIGYVLATSSALANEPSGNPLDVTVVNQFNATNATYNNASGVTTTRPPFNVTAPSAAHGIKVYVWWLPKNGGGFGRTPSLFVSNCSGSSSSSSSSSGQGKYLGASKKARGPRSK